MLQDKGLPAGSSAAEVGWRAILNAGANDFGGISPVTRDYVNPEKPWPHLHALASATAAASKALVPRYAHISHSRAFLHAAMDLACSTNLQPSLWFSSYLFRVMKPTSACAYLTYSILLADHAPCSRHGKKIRTRPLYSLS